MKKKENEDNEEEKEIKKNINWLLDHKVLPIEILSIN